MARQGGGVQLQLCNMHWALNMPKMAKGRISPTATEKTQNMMKKFCPEVREEKKWGVECSVHRTVKAARGRHSAMLCKY